MKLFSKKAPVLMRKRILAVFLIMAHMTMAAVPYSLADGEALPPAAGGIEQAAWEIMGDPSDILPVVSEAAQEILNVIANGGVSAELADIALGQIENGDVTIEQIGKTINIMASENAIATFLRFNNALDYILNITIRGAEGAAPMTPAYFKIFQDAPTQLLGTQNFDGPLFLYNPFGFFNGPDSVNTITGGPLVMTTLGLSNADFLAGNYALAQDSAFAPGYILNEGKFYGQDGASIALIAGAIRNAGIISSEGGAVALAVGGEVSLNIDDRGLISAHVDDGVEGTVYDFSGNRVSDGLAQAGTVSANGGIVLLSADAKEQVFDLLINHTGMTEARSMIEKNGEIIISGGKTGKVRMNGIVDADGRDNVSGGSIEIRGGDIEIKDGAILSARGHGENSDGGKIEVLAEDHAVLENGAVIDARGGEISGDGGFIELSGKNVVDLDGGVMLASATNGAAGTVLVDPSVLNISVNDFTLGANKIYQADKTINIASGVVISSRQVSGGAAGDHLIDVSNGDSGSLTFLAPEILVGSGAKILAQADGAFTAGDITMTALDTSGVIGLLTPLKVTTAKIVLDGATLKGRDVNLTATADSAQYFDDLDSTVDMVIDILGSVHTIAGVALSEADADITVTGNTNISGRNISMIATAKSEADVKTISTAIGAAYGQSDADAHVVLESGTTINATGDFKMNSEANSHLDVLAFTVGLGTGPGAQVDIAAAVAISDIHSKAEIKSGATVNAGGTAEVKSIMKKDHSVNASGSAYQDGTVGVGVAISISESNSSALVDGTLNGAGGVTVASESTTSKNDTTASSSAGSGLVAAHAINASQGLLGSVGTFAIAKTPTTNAQAGSKQAGLSASFAYAEHENNSTARIGDNASVSSTGGEVEVTSTIVDVVETSALAAVDSASTPDKKAAFAGAVVLGDFTNTSNALIGKNATVNANKEIVVRSTTSNPYEIQWHQIHGFADVADKLNANFGIQNGFFTSWAQSSATASDIGIAGSVNFLKIDNTSHALIDTDAQINQNASFRSVNQDVTVEALNDISTINLSGVFGFGLGVTSGKTGIGASYLDVDYASDVQAKIAKGVDLYADSLKVNTSSTTRNISIAEAGGKADQIAVNGAFSFLTTENKLLSQVDDGATIVTGNGDIDGLGNSVLVQASDEARIFTGSGGLTKGGNVGIGASVSINDIKRETRAIIGNKTGETNDAGSLATDGSVLVSAENTGEILSASLAAAVQDASPTAPGTDLGAIGKVGIGISGDVAFNTIEDDTEAAVRDANITKADDVKLSAKNNSDILSAGGSVAISTGTSFLSGGLAGAYVKNEINNEADAVIDNSLLDITGDLGVNAKNEGDITSITASGSGAAKRAIAGSVSVNVIANSTRAAVKNSSDINGSKTAAIKAEDDSKIFAVAGSIGFSTGKSGSGSGSATNNINNVIKASVEDSDISASVKTDITADANNQIEAYAAALGADINGGASGSSTVRTDFDSDIAAYVKGKKTDGISSTGDITITATDKSTLFAAGGNLALNGGTDSGKGKTLAFNTMNNSLKAYAEGAKLNSTAGKITLTADSQAKAETIGVGGVGSGGNAIAVNLSKNDVSNELDAHISDSSDVDAAGDITVEAKDSAELKGLAGVISGGGKNSVGEVFAMNEIDNGLKAYIDNSSVNSAGGTLTAKTISTSKIQALAATGTAAAGTASLAGAQSIDLINNIYDSHITNSADIKADKIVVLAQDSSTIESLAGALSFGAKGSAGASVSTADITNSIKAYMNNVNAVADTNGVEVKAVSSGTVKNITAGGAGAGDYALGGSVTVNDIDNTIDAYITNSYVEGVKEVIISATDSGLIESLAGTVTGAGTATLGAAVATNDIANDVRAYVENSTVISTTDNVSITASSANTIKSLSAGISGAGTAAISGAVSLNKIGGETNAHSLNSTVTGAKGVSITATETSTIQSISGAAGGAGTAGIGGSAAYNELTNTVKAYAENGSITATNDSVMIKAASTGSIDTISAGGAVGGTAGVAGSVAIGVIAKTVEAYIKGATVTANDSVGVIADMSNTMNVYGGTFSAGGTVGIGGTVVINTFANTVKAYISNSANVTAKGNDVINVPKADTTNGTENVRGLAVVADVNEDLNIYTANAVGGGKVGVSANVSNTVSEDVVEAYIDGSTIGNTDAHSLQATRVKASNTTDVEVKAGGLTLGGLGGVGGTNDNTILQNTTKSYINNATVNTKSGGVFVETTTKERVNTNVVSGSGGGVSVAGSVGVVDIKGINEAHITGSTVNSDGDLKVIATDNADIDANAGTVAIGGAAGVGGSVVVASIGNNTSAHITNSITNAKGGTEVKAKSISDINTNTATGALSGYVGAGGAVSVNTIETTTQAFINETGGGTTQINQNSAFDTASQDVKVTAEDTAGITARDGNITVAGTAAFGAAVNVSTIKNTVLSSIGGGTVVSAANDVLVTANAAKTIDSIVVAFSGAMTGGVSGAVSIINIGSALSGDGNSAAANTQSVVNSEISGSPVSDAAGSSSTATTATAKVNSKTSVLSVTDELSTGATAANSTTASIGADAVVDAGSDIKVSATENTRADSRVGAAALGLLGAGGAVALTSINNRTNALVGDRADLSAGDNVEVTATGNINDSDAESFTGTAGLISLGAAVSIFKSDNDVTAALGNNVKVKKADDLKVTANMVSDIRAAGTGASAGAATAGVVISKASETGTSDAYIGNNGVIGGTDTAPAVANVYVTGKSDALVQSEATASTAGILAGSGADAAATSNPNTSAHIGSSTAIRATNNVVVEAKGTSKAKANAQGAAIGALSAGISLASASSFGNISAYTGDSSNIEAGNDFVLKSSFNRNTDGSGILDAEWAVSRASSGASLLGAAAADSTTHSSISTWATTGNSSVVKAGNDSFVTTNNYHAAYVETTSIAAGGVISTGGAHGKITMGTSATATTGSNSRIETGRDNTVASVSQSNGKTSVTGGTGRSITDALKDLINGNILNFFTGGGLGSLISLGGAASEVVIENTAASTVGTNAVMKAGDDMNVTADGIVDVDTFTKMTSKGTLLVAAMAATDVFVDSDATVNVNSGAKVSGQRVKLRAANQLDLKAFAEAISQVTIINSIAAAMSRLNVGSSGDASEAKVNIGANAEITGKESVTIEAVNFQESANLLSHAKSFADGGVAAIANTLADSTLYANSKIVMDSGVKVTTGEAVLHAETSLLADRIAESRAETVTKKLVKVVRTVVEEVCTWLPWPLDDLCDYVTKEVFDFIEELTLSFENEKTGGSGLVGDDSMVLNGQFYNVGGEGKKLLVNSDGSIDASSNIGATITDKVYVDDVVNNTPSIIKFLVPKGSLSGSAVINLNKVLDKVNITNNTNLDLVMNKINMISDNGGEPDVTYKYITGSRFEVKAQEHESKLNITNNGTGDILFNSAIANNAADFDFRNAGGDIIAQNSGVAFDMYHVNLRADNGSLGSAAQRLNFNLFKAKTLPDSTAVNTDNASLSAFSYGDMHLNIDSVTTEFAQYDAATASITGFDIGDLTSFGKVDVKLQTGTLYSFYQNPACLTCSGLKVNEAPTTYNVKNVTAGQSVTLDMASNVKTTLDGTITSGLQDITFDIDANGNTSSNLFNHEASRTADKIVLKDIPQGSGKITINGALDGTGTLKVQDGYTKLKINNASNLDVEVHQLDVDQRINKQLTVNSDTDVQSNEYGSVQVVTTGYNKGDIAVNNTGNSDILIVEALENSSGAVTLTANQGSILNAGTDNLIKANGITLNASNAIGQGTEGLLTDLTGGLLNATAGGNVKITETANNLDVGAVTSTAGNVTLTAKTGDLNIGAVNASQGQANLKASGAILDTGDAAFGEALGAEADVTARSAVMEAGNGVGTQTNGLETRLTGFGGLNGNGNLEANGGNGGVYLANEGSNGFGLTLGGIGALGQAILAKGGIKILSGSPLTVAADVSDTAGGNIVLAALGNTAGDDLIVNANVSAFGGNGIVTLVAGDSLVLNNNKTVSAAGSGAVNLFAGEDWTDNTQDQDGTTGAFGGSINLTNGTTVSSSSGKINADAAGDISLSVLQTGSNAAAAVNVTSRSGAIIDTDSTGVDIVTGTSGEAVLKAAKGIGSGNAIETSVGHLDAVNTASGHLQIDETLSGGALGLNRVLQQGAGDVTVRTLDGTLTVNAGGSGVSAQSGLTTLFANDDSGFLGDDDLVINALVQSTTGGINLRSFSRDILLSAPGDVTSNSGNVDVQAIGDFFMADGAVINAGSGLINTFSLDNTTLGSLRTTSNAANAVKVWATGGAIIDGGDTDIDVITGSLGTLTMIAQVGIGHDNAIDTSIGNLDVTNNIFLDVNVDEVASGGNLGIKNAVQNGPGHITIRTLDGTLTVNADESGVTAKEGTITLQAEDADLSGNSDLILNDTVTSTSGDIHLNSLSRDVLLNAEGDVTSSSGTITSSAARDIVMRTSNVVTTNSGSVIYNADRDVFMDADSRTATGSGLIDYTAGRDIFMGDTALVESTSGSVTYNADQDIFMDVNSHTAADSGLIDYTAGRDIFMGDGALVESVLGSVTYDAGQDVFMDDGSHTATDSGLIDYTAGRDIFMGDRALVESNSGSMVYNAGQDVLMEDGSLAMTGTGTIHFTAGRDIGLASVQSGSAAADAVLLTATLGEVFDNGDLRTNIFARNGTTTIRANTGIGSADMLETQMLNFSAVTDQGNIQIDNTGSFNVVTANGVSGVSITDTADLDLGNVITMQTHSPLTVTAGSPVVNNAGGDINLFALGDQIADDLTLIGDVVTNGGNGNILLVAGDSITMAAGTRVSAEADGDITVVSGEDFTDGLFDQDGNKNFDPLTNPNGGDVFMNGTASILTDSGDVLVDAANNFGVGVVNADADGDDVRGDVTGIARAGSILDTNGPDLNITSDHLRLLSGGEIGTRDNPLEIKTNVLDTLSVGSTFFYNLGSILANMTSIGGNIELEVAGGNILLGTAHASGGEVGLTASGSIFSQSSAPARVIADRTIRMIAGGLLGTPSNAINVELKNPGTLKIAAGTESDRLSANITGNFSSNSVSFLNLPPGLVFLNSIAVGGTNIGALTAATAAPFFQIPSQLLPNDLFDGRFAADFPGLFSQDRYAQPRESFVDTASLDEVDTGAVVIVEPDALPPIRVPMPAVRREQRVLTPAKTETAVLRRPFAPRVKPLPAQDTVADEDTPPAVVPIPAVPQPAQDQPIEN